MKSLDVKDLRGKTVPELEEMVKQERAALYKARRDLVFRQLTDFKSVSVRRHNVARILTVITEKQRGIEREPVAAKVKAEAKPKRGKAK